jgi:hypothetical protein
MSLADTASIAQATITLAGTGQPLAAGVLTCFPGDCVVETTRATGEALGMEVVEIRMLDIEYHPGALNHVAYYQVEPAVATGRPVLFMLVGADYAQRCVLAAIASAISKRVEEAPCVILALSRMCGERDVLEQVAEGLDRETNEVLCFRTAEEERRLIEEMLEAGRR